MKSLLIFIFPLLILLGKSTNATKVAEPVTQISARDRYQGGWPLALMASDTAGCPAEAPVSCQNANTNLECCPVGQFCYIPDDTSEQYCCPTESDCRDAVQNFLVCANSSWILYEGLPNFFCCKPGYIATERNQGGPGFCEPADVDVPANKLGPTISQYTAAASIPALTAAATVAASASETTETHTAITGTITTTAGGLSTDTTTPTGSILSTANGKSLTSIAIATANNTASSTGFTTALTAPSVQTIAVATTLSTAGNPGSGSVSTSASASVKTITGIGASKKPAVLGIVVALSGVGVLGFIG